MDFKKMLEGYKKQQEQAKEIYIKLQGKIELCKEVLEKEVKKKDKK